jgi:hypothetical protein
MEYPPDTSDASVSSASVASFGRRLAAMLGFGVVGVVGLALSTALGVSVDPTIVERSGLPADASLPIAVVSSVATPAVVVVVAAAVGTATAPRFGFRSLVHERVARGGAVLGPLRDLAPRALAVGITTGVGIVAVDAALTTVVPAAVASGPTERSVALVATSAPARFLYGGVAEELLLRWGLVSALAWVLATVVPSEHDRAIAGTAVVLAAGAFGLAHLPSAAASTTLTPALVARVVLLNAAAGVVFGWLYVADALEAAMLAHAAAHVPLLAAALIGVL